MPKNQSTCNQQARSNKRLSKADLRYLHHQVNKQGFLLEDIAELHKKTVKELTVQDAHDIEEGLKHLIYTDAPLYDHSQPLSTTTLFEENNYE
jgi:hypothetical protein